MVKKLFTLVALLAVCFGAQAKEVEDVYIDFSTASEIKYYGWGASESARERLSLQDGCLYFHSEEATDPTWDCQFHPVGINGAAEEGTVYTMTLEIKGSDAGTISAHFAGVTNYGAINFTTDWQVVTVQYEATKSDNACLFQCGGYVGDYWIKWIKITHEEVEGGAPEVWKELMTNGNAEGAYGDIPCAYSKEFNRYQREDGMPENEPYPCDIEDDGTGNKVFVVHAKQVNPDDFAEGAQYYEYPGGNATGAYAWMNQFWIQSPKSWKGGEQVKVSFRYKASKAVQADTQCHGETPGSYLHWDAIGAINFTEDWQTYESKVTIPDAGNGMWSIAFNLKDVATDVTYYFDDLSWQELDLEEGYFIAYANADEGLAYNFSTATKMEWVEDEAYYTGTVGTQDEPVHEIMIGTKRGNDKSFQASTLKPTRTVTDDPDDWNDYEAKAKTEIKLPGSGVWVVRLDPEYKSMSFEMVWGTPDAPKELVEIVANPLEIVVAGVERDDIKDDDHPDGTGAAWDNQFWIMANRALKAGEETYLEFEYMGSVDARTTTQCHGDAGAYMHWAAIGDVNFTTSWQKYEGTFTVPNEGDGMKSIAFNMAEIKGACDYHIKNVIWCVGSKEESYESLIDMTGDKNFWWKVSAGTAPVQGDPAGIENVTVGTKVNNTIYNLAGQKVNNSYKGIVIQNGKKFVK